MALLAKLVTYLKIILQAVVVVVVSLFRSDKRKSRHQIYTNTMYNELSRRSATTRYRV